MKTERKGNTIKVIAEAGDEYCSDLIGKPMCRIRDNGNGWDVKFYSHRSTHADVRLNLDYDQLPLLVKACEALEEHEK